jgi:DNA invertase Pin-like site-specific DNA recombinase
MENQPVPRRFPRISAMADAPRKKLLRCAIYTRKSSEEGLEQDFNSLHAQREACEAYIASQKHEGWKAISTAYDDGGFSGGSMERPALQQLLVDVAAGEIDVVVVYKVDRLTRSLSDFARIVDVFDKQGVSFVSVTQAFNTTSSMGRLTLNVLLSFAQFEREVTGERIRDKIAASKKKGLWMGGFVPIGYDKAGRTLTIREDEAATIRTIYARYLELKSVDVLKDDLEKRGLKTRPRPNGSEHTAGGKPFSRGHLYRILSNPIYTGQIEHKGQTYEGQHPAIIDQFTFDAVQATLAANSHARLVKAYSKDPSLLSGLVYDQSGDRLVATHTTKQGRRYRYYLSHAALSARRRGRAAADSVSGVANAVWRLPAAEVEGPVIRLLVEALTDEHWLADNLELAGQPVAARRAVAARARDLAGQLDSDDPVARRSVILLLVERVVLETSAITVNVRTTGIAEPIDVRTIDGAPAGPHQSHTVTLSRSFATHRRGPEIRLIIDGDEPREPQVDPVLVSAIAKAHRWWGDLLDHRYATIRELSAAYDTDERYVAWIVPLAFLPPALVRAILDGTQPGDITLQWLLTRADLPLEWQTWLEWQT